MRMPAGVALFLQLCFLLHKRFLKMQIRLLETVLATSATAILKTLEMT
jgi:hypothetical protein